LINKKQLNFIDDSPENSSIKESTAALQLLNIGAEFLPNILLYKAELLIKHILFKLDKQVVNSDRNGKTKTKADLKLRSRSHL
jgi:hypothetical protein